MATAACGDQPPGNTYTGQDPDAAVSVDANGSDAANEPDATVPVEMGWSRRIDFPGASGPKTAAFAVGPFGYAVVEGKTYRYDPAADHWQIVAAFPGLARRQASAYATDEAGYVIGGYYGGEFVELASVWRYTPSDDRWDQLADFPGGTRAGAVAFFLGQRGYFGTGAGNAPGAPGFEFFNDLWQHNPTNDSWLKVASLPGAGRREATAFASATSAVVGLGYPGGGALGDIYQYNPVLDTWSNLPPLGERYLASGFALGSTFYVGAGTAANFFQQSDFYHFDEQLAAWLPDADVGAGTITGASSFVIDGAAYLVGAGSSANQEVSKQTWRFGPVPATP